MGECGCGEITDYQCRKVGDYVLVVEKHSGCRYCHTGLMVGVHLFTQEEADAFQFDYSEEFKPDKHGHSQIDVIFEGTEVEKEDDDPYYGEYIDRIGSRR
jgi:hypothetical protein